MKMKKVMALVLASLMTVSLAACGESTDAPASTDAGTTSTDASTEEASTTDDASTEEAATELSGKLTIWTFTDDLKTAGEYFQELNPNVEVEVVVTATADYPTKLDTGLGAGDSSADIIVGEPQMLEPFFEAGYFEDLDAAPYNAQDYAGQIVDYVWEKGQDADGHQYHL